MEVKNAMHFDHTSPSKIPSNSSKTNEMGKEVYL